MFVMLNRTMIPEKNIVDHPLEDLAYVGSGSQNKTKMLRGSVFVWCSQDSH